MRVPHGTSCTYLNWYKRIPLLSVQCRWLEMSRLNIRSVNTDDIATFNANHRDAFTLQYVAVCTRNSEMLSNNG